MQIKIYYRLSDKGRRDHKPDYITVQNCLRNFCKHFGTQDIVVIADNIEEDTFDFIRSLISPTNIIRTRLGNSKSFCFALKKAIEDNGDDTIIYLVEDDYLHAPGSRKILGEGFQKGDYVSLYDHPDKYMANSPNPHVKDGGEETKVFVTDSIHWKMTNSTTMTFASRVRTLKEDYHTIIKYCASATPLDFLMFRELLTQQKRRLVTCIPAKSTHGQRPWMSPLVQFET